MRGVLITSVVLQALVPSPLSAIEGKVLVELNTVESSENHCRINFVLENRSEQALESMKLDLVVFGTDGGIMHRFISEMAPLQPMKTVVRSFSVESGCPRIGAILVNDVTACVPIEPNACLGRLELSSRLKAIRLYK
jgi:hypothetical protein